MVELGINPLHYGLMVRPLNTLSVMFPPTFFAEATLGLMSRDEIKYHLSQVTEQLNKGNGLEQTLEFFESSKKKKQGNITVEDLERILVPKLPEAPSERTLKAHRKKSMNLIKMPAFKQGILKQERRTGTVSLYDLLNIEIKSRSRGTTNSPTFFNPIIKYPYLSNVELNDGYLPTCNCRYHRENIGRDRTDRSLEQSHPKFIGTKVGTRIMCYELAAASIEFSNEINEISPQMIRNLRKGQPLLPFDFSKKFDLVLEAFLKRYKTKQTYSKIDRFLMEHISDIITRQFNQFVKNNNATVEALLFRQNFLDIPDKKTDDERELERKKLFGQVKSNQEYRAYTDIIKEIQISKIIGGMHQGYALNFKGSEYETFGIVFEHRYPVHSSHIVFDKNIPIPLVVEKTPIAPNTTNLVTGDGYNTIMKSVIERLQQDQFYNTRRLAEFDELNDKDQKPYHVIIKPPTKDTLQKARAIALNKVSKV